MKFNVATMGTKTVNLAGGKAHQESPKLELVSILLTSFVQDQFYRKAEGTLTRLQELVAAIPDKKFVAQAAIYARRQFGMRSITHALAGELARKSEGEQWRKRFYDQIVYRPDDMLEILAYYQGIKGSLHPIPNAMRKGFAQAITRFDAYQLAKYRGEGKTIKMVDVVNLLHPKASDLFKSLVDGTLHSTDTWEAKLTQAGQADTDEEKEEQKAEAWKELLVSRKLGYFALLRNLRNIMQQAPEMLSAALEMLIDEKLIAKSLVLPFRYLTAIEEIQKVSGAESRRIVAALNVAIDRACANVPKLDGETLVVLDESGSMDGQPITIGSLFAAILVKANNADYMGFSNNAHYLSLNPMDSVLTIAQMILAQRQSGGTNFHAIFNRANHAYARIIILSDMQGWMGYETPVADFAQYRSKHQCDPKVFSFDLAGHGTLQFPERNVYCLAGFSEKVFNIMALLEQDRNALIAEIERVTI